VNQNFFLAVYIRDLENRSDLSIDYIHYTDNIDISTENLFVISN